MVCVTVVWFVYKVLHVNSTLKALDGYCNPITRQALQLILDLKDNNILALLPNPEDFTYGIKQQRKLGCDIELKIVFWWLKNISFVIYYAVESQLICGMVVCIIEKYEKLNIHIF